MVAGSDGKAHQQTVKAGFHEGDKVQILDGLQAGQKIVGSGAYGLPDNSKITAAEANNPAADDANKPADEKDKKE